MKAHSLAATASACTLSMLLAGSALAQDPAQDEPPSGEPPAAAPQEPSAGGADQGGTMAQPEGEAGQPEGGTMAQPEGEAGQPEDGTMAQPEGDMGAPAGEATAGAEGEPISEAAYMVSDLMDKDVRNAQDEELGQVQNLLVSEDGRVTHAVVGAGGVLGVGQEMYAVPWDRLQFSPDQEHVVLNVEQDQMSTEFSAFEESQVKGGESPEAGAEPAAGEDPAQAPEEAPQDQ